MLPSSFDSFPGYIIPVCSESRNYSNSGRDLKVESVLQEENMDVSQVAGAILAGGEAEVPILSAAADGASACLNHSLTSVSTTRRKSIENLARLTASDGSSSPRKILQLREKIVGTADSSNIVPHKEPKPLPPPVLPPNNPETNLKHQSLPYPSISSLKIDAAPYSPRSSSSMANKVTSEVLGEVISTGESNTESSNTPSKTDVSFVFQEGLGKATLKRLSDVFAKFSEDAIDVYTQNTFGELIRERKNIGLPYFIAVINIEADGEVPLIVDGISFLRDYFRWGRAMHPTTRDPVTSFMIFKNGKKMNVFKLFCSHANIRSDKDHFAKWINACDPYLNPILRGRERFYLACHYMDSVHACTDSLTKLVDAPMSQDKMRLDLNEKRECYSFKNEFWLLKAAEDEYLMAYLNLAYLYLADAEEDISALNIALLYLRKAVDKAQDLSLKNVKILKACLHVFMDFPETCAEDIDRVRALLLSHSRLLSEQQEEETSHQYFFDHQ